MSTVPESVMATLRKLAEMRVDRGCTPAEAALAASHLERLLEKHQLSMFDVKSGQYNEQVTEDQLRMGLKLVPQWAYSLARAVSKPHDCEYFSLKHYGGGVTADGRGEIVDVSITFVGHKSDVIVCQHLFTTLSRLLVGMADRDGKQIGRRGTHLFQFRKQYLVAAATEIFNRLWAERNAARAEQETKSASTALVVVKDRAVTEYVAKKHPNLRKVKTKVRRWDHDALDLGRKAGRSVPINKAVEGEKRQAITA